MAVFFDTGYEDALSNGRLHYDAVTAFSYGPLEFREARRSDNSIEKDGLQNLTPFW